MLEVKDGRIRGTVDEVLKYLYQKELEKIEVPKIDWEYFWKRVEEEKKKRIRVRVLLLSLVVLLLLVCSVVIVLGLIQ